MTTSPEWDDPQLNDDTLIGHINRAGGFAELAAKWGATPERLAEVIKAMRPDEREV